MRSEERYGIIYAVLLLLWGTLFTEPLHIFTGYFYDALLSFEAVAGISASGILGSLIIVVILLFVTLLLLNTAKSELYKFLPCILMGATTLILLVRTIESGKVNAGNVIGMIVMLAIIGLAHLIKNETVLLWLCDICAASMSVFLTVSLILEPLAAINSTMSKILFATKGMSVNLAVAFDGLFTLPAAVWGVFFGIIILLPQIYSVFLGRQG